MIPKMHYINDGVYIIIAYIIVYLAKSDPAFSVEMQTRTLTRKGAHTVRCCRRDSSRCKTFVCSRGGRRRDGNPISHRIVFKRFNRANVTKHGGIGEIRTWENMQC